MYTLILICTVIFPGHQSIIGITGVENLVTKGRELRALEEEITSVARWDGARPEEKTLELERLSGDTNVRVPVYRECEET